VNCFLNEIGVDSALNTQVLMNFGKHHQDQLFTVAEFHFAPLTTLIAV